jgi:DNA-directed RNA polymerase III subunit RPC1
MAASEVIAVPMGKEQVVDDMPKVIKEIHFGVLSNQDIVNQSHVELSDRRLFNLDHGRENLEYGPLDQRMGIIGKLDKCPTCHESFQQCCGHFGHVRLVLPCFHVGYFKKIISILQSICKV